MTHPPSQPHGAPGQQPPRPSTFYPPPAQGYPGQPRHPMPPAGPLPPSAPGWGQVPPPKPVHQQWWFWMVIVLGVFFAAGVFQFLSNLGGQTPSRPRPPASTSQAERGPAPTGATKTKDPATPPPASGKTPAPAPQIGVPVSASGIDFTVTEVSETTVLRNALFGNKEGHWTVVKVTIANNTKEAAIFDDSLFTLVEADGSRYETDSDSLLYLNDDEELFLEKINPKQERSGTLLFATPEGIQPDRLIAETKLFGGNRATIRLR